MKLLVLNNVNLMSELNRTDITSIKCPQCGGNLVLEGGCNTCKDCGWSKCDW